MFNWVQKIKKTTVDITPKPAVQVSLTSKPTVVEKKVERVSKYIQRFDENLEKLADRDIKDLKQYYQDLWGKPNNFLNNRDVLVYLISRLQIQHEWE